MSDTKQQMRSTCDMRDSHGKPEDQRWSWEWLQYFHLCGRCLKVWDSAAQEEAKK